MSEDREPITTKQDLPDELPRSAVSDERSRLTNRDPRARRLLVWCAFAVVVVAIAVALFWIRPR